MRSRLSRGSVSMYALLIMFVLLIASMGVSALSAGSMAKAGKERDTVAAFQAAQAGLEQGITLAFKDLDENNGVFETTSYNMGPVIQSFASGATGSVTVEPTPTDNTYAYITSVATASGRRRSVRTLVMAKNVGIWNNAIFAGTGAAGRAINGNVDIRGSVHILGDGEPYTDLNGNAKWDAAELFNDKNNNKVWDPGETWTDANGDGVWNSAEPYNDSNANGFYDPPLTQTDLNSAFGGNAYIGNNYSGMPLGLEAMVPPPPRPGNIESLSTEVRVKHGQISISGSATVGYNGTVDGGTSKAKIDGSYVSDGYTGSGGANSVYSDNGTGNAYDLGHLGIDFPLLEGIGAQPYVDKSGNVWANQHTFLTAKSMLVPVNNLTSSTAAFTFGPDLFGNKISYTPPSGGNPAILDITGIVRVTGDIQIGGKSFPIRYKGNGTIYASQDIKIDGDFLPASGQTFPTTARVGLIARRNMALSSGSGSSQLSMAGAFYAQGQISSQKQNQIAGTFVANFFDMGTNVPNIYQVPSLPHNMPPGMPGDKNYYTLKQKTWRERQVAQP